MADEEKGQKGNMPTPTEMAAFAREYMRAYLDSVSEKSPEHVPPIAQQSPYDIEITLLPNNCYAMILQAASEMKVRATFSNWEDLQDAVVKGVDFFIGFYPHEMKSIADWRKRGRKDATRDMRIMSESELGQAAGSLIAAIDEISRMAASNPWLAEKANAQIQTLKDIENRLRQGFAPMDAIAALQDLKAYKPTYEKMVIEFPDRELLDKILHGIEDLMTLKERMDTLESRMFEVERTSAMKSTDEEDMVDVNDKIADLEGHLEKVSNILQLLNTKVEKYFSKTAEVERQSAVETKVQEMVTKLNALMDVVSKMQTKQSGVDNNVANEISRLEEEIDRVVRRLKKLERHFVEVAKSVEE